MALFDPKAKNIANYQKSIDEKMTTINRYYDDIGRLYYKQYVDINADNTKDINTRCDAIKRLYQEISGLNVKILYEKGLKLCPNCKTENALHHTFCFKCGACFASANENSQPDVAADVVAEPAPEAPVPAENAVVVAEEPVAEAVEPAPEVVADPTIATPVE